jgi:hypothetical protein
MYLGMEAYYDIPDRRGDRRQRTAAAARVSKASN